MPHLALSAVTAKDSDKSDAQKRSGRPTRRASGIVGEPASSVQHNWNVTGRTARHRQASEFVVKRILAPAAQHIERKSL